MKERMAYERIFTWYKKNRHQIKRIYQREDAYSKYSLKLTSILPAPETATPEDMVLTAQQVLMGLFEWAYHQKDSHGRKMHEYARVILENIDAETINIERSRLNRVVSEFRDELRR